MPSNSELRIKATVSQLVTKQIHLLHSNTLFLNTCSNSSFNSFHCCKEQEIENSRLAKGLVLTFISLLLLKYLNNIIEIYFMNCHHT